MPRQEVTFEFPDPDKDDVIEIEKPAGRTNPLEKPEEGEKDDLDIEIVDDTPPKDRNKKPAPPPEEVTDEELGGYSEKVKKRIQHFTKSYHDERRAKEQALREREELERFTAGLLEEVKTLKGNAGKSQNALLTQAKQTADLELSAAEAQYRAAYEAGDTDKVVAAQKALTKAQLKVDRVANFRPAPLQDKTTQVQTDTNTQSSVSAPKREPDTRAVQWGKENPWYGTDDEMTAYALGVHNKLVKSKADGGMGIDPKSDEYYETLNSRMRKVFPDNFEQEEVDDETPAEKTPAAKPKATVATASRGVAPRKIKLTATQVQLAKKLGVPLEEYAKSAAALMRTN